jgi:hypothetical protein
MNSKLRRLKINELKARILRYELENSGLMRELGSSSTSTGRRAEIYRRWPRLEFEHTEALNDLAWVTAEDRLQRPDSVGQLTVLLH